MQVVSRKRFVNTLSVAGLGLGLLAGATGAPLVMAQPHQLPGIERPLLQSEARALDLSDEELDDLLIQLLQEREQRQERADARALQGDEDVGDMFLVPGDHEALRVDAYTEFTQALADELGIDNPDKVDAAIRAAMMATVDANTGLSETGAEEQKALIAESDAPIGPTYRGHGG